MRRIPASRWVEHTGGVPVQLVESDDPLVYRNRRHGSFIVHATPMHGPSLTGVTFGSPYCQWPIENARWALVSSKPLTSKKVRTWFCFSCLYRIKSFTGGAWNSARQADGPFPLHIAAVSRTQGCGTMFPLFQFNFVQCWLLLFRTTAV